MIKSTVLLYLVIGIGIWIGIGYLGLNPQVNELQESIQYKDEQMRDLKQEQISDKNNIANLELDVDSLSTEINNNKQSLLILDEQICEYLFFDYLNWLESKQFVVPGHDK